MPRTLKVGGLVMFHYHEIQDLSNMNIFQKADEVFGAIYMGYRYIYNYVRCNDRQYYKIYKR